MQPRLSTKIRFVDLDKKQLLVGVWMQYLIGRGLCSADKGKVTTKARASRSWKETGGPYSKQMAYGNVRSTVIRRVEEVTVGGDIGIRMVEG